MRKNKRYKIDEEGYVVEDDRSAFAWFEDTTEYVANHPVTSVLVIAPALMVYGFMGMFYLGIKGNN